MNNNRFAVKFSFIAIIIIISHTFFFKDFWKSWKNNETQFVWDVNNYYAYLPATFIHHDLTFNFPSDYWLIEAPNGVKVPKGTCGMSIMYAPFFLLGHKIAINSHEPLTGYSAPYSDLIHYGTIFYALIAFLFLQSILCRYFRDPVVAITLLCLFFGTNLFYYIVGEGEMSHGYLFCLFSVCLWLIIKWHETPKIKYSIFLGLIIGLITLIRPTEVIISLVFVLYGVTNFRSFKEKITQLVSNWKHLLIISVCFIVALSPQLIYWKYMTGNFFFFSYGGGERFFFGDPKIINVLFSYRKGWLLYTPIMAFSIFGMFFGKKHFPKLQFPFVLYFILNLYLVSSWWCWWFGGGFGMRALTQSYCFLAFFLAAFINQVIELQLTKKLFESLIKYVVITLVCFFISLNLIQTYQYNRRILHFDSMSKKAYWTVFCKFELNGNEPELFWKSIRPIDYEKAKQGERE